MCERPALPSRSPAVRKLVFPKSEGSALACLGGRSIVAKLRNSGRFARAAAQIVKFRPAHHATANDIDALDVRRVEREHMLYTPAEGNLAHGRLAERRVGQACVSPCRSRWSPYHTTQNTQISQHQCPEKHATMTIHN